jgi:hypothetical protein
VEQGVGDGGSIRRLANAFFAGRPVHPAIPRAEGAAGLERGKLLQSPLDPRDFPIEAGHRWLIVQRTIVTKNPG